MSEDRIKELYFEVLRGVSYNRFSEIIEEVFEEGSDDGYDIGYDNGIIDSELNKFKGE